jgi:hypothetical protein
MNQSEEKLVRSGNVKKQNPAFAGLIRVCKQAAARETVQPQRKTSPALGLRCLFCHLNRQKTRLAF